jgi:hypothetical protein
MFICAEREEGLGNVKEDSARRCLGMERRTLSRVMDALAHSYLYQQKAVRPRVKRQKPQITEQRQMNISAKRLRAAKHSVAAPIFRVFQSSPDEN